MDSDPEPSFLRVQVWGLFLESIGFGVYLVTCGFCYRALFPTASRHRGLSEMNWSTIVIFLIFLAKTTSSLGIHLFLNLESATTANRVVAANQFRDGSRPINMSKYNTSILQTVIASAFFIYRCWLVYHRSWLTIALPLLLWLGAVALMGFDIHLYDTALSTIGLFSSSRAQAFGSAFWAVITAINVIITAQIAYRICQVDHYKSRSDVQLHSSDSLPTKTKAVVTCSSSKFAIHTVIESGMMYTAMTVLVFVLFVTKSVAVYAAIDGLVQIIGISFNLVIIYNQPRPQRSSLDELNSVPLQFTSTNSSVPGSAIEFAYPKHFNPRRKNKTTPTEPVKEDGDLSPDTGIPKNHSQQSIR
ncbi:hypothetical protein MSAN_00653000 [Mycena sanguinolenta]|uniref:Uncharacterized protein n=1 Tax=Mycena sanguinolenta TaxID=230812 RepID=A0A8H6Z3W1_9AGAR|nr:hypothetical protein MSAN_00653000 [Mycena sanguinolenta]